MLFFEVNLSILIREKRNCAIVCRTRDVGEKLSLKLNVTFSQVLGRSSNTRYHLGTIIHRQADPQLSRSRHETQVERRQRPGKAGWLAGVSARDDNSSGEMTRRHSVSKNAAARPAGLFLLSGAGKREISATIVARNR